ncbi:MAG TPA: hypothetical protein VG273_22530 [Bryobacteraceae bacterium]|nr:hypothetical protein [Bryobacteraceae bacterium]
MKRTFLADSLLIFVFTTVLIWPLFRLKYLDNWPSIESTFISDARMVGEHLPHPGWQPLWYCGTRYDYIYPPALRYGPALIAKAWSMTTARAYHLYTAFLYVFGMIAMYLMIRVGTASRAAAWLGTAGLALVSPSFALIAQVRHDSGYLVPQRLHVLEAWGEGPHISALCILPAAIAASYLAFRKWRPGMLAAAAVLCALVVTNNFYGASSLAFFFPILVWAVWNGERDRRIFQRAAGIAVLAWGLCAFWLTPSYLKYTVINLQWVSQPGTPGWIATTVAAFAVFGLVTFKIAGRRAEYEWPVFVAGAALIMCLDVLGFYYRGYRLVGEPPRLVPELDLALILVAVEIGRRVWRLPKGRFAVVLLAATAFYPSIRYVRQAWSPFPKSGPLENQYPYQMSKWVSEHLPGQRVLPTGELRFWFDAWSDNAQPDGGSLQGMENQIIPVATWQILAGDKPGLAIQWLQALGTDAAIVAAPGSLEPYRDYTYPNKFAGVLPVLLDNQHGTVVYRVPRIYPNIGRIVDRNALGSVGKFRGGDDGERMSKYVAVIEDPAQPSTAVAWHGFDEVNIQAKTTTGHSILLQETYDTSWHAFEGGKELPVRLEPAMGFMLLDVTPGDHSIQMRFETPTENRVGQLLLGLSLLVAVALFTRAAQASGVSRRAESESSPG